MNHRAICPIATAGLILGIAAIFPCGAGDAPKLSASYQISDVGSATAPARLTFSFELHTEGGYDVTVDKVILADPATADAPYATFDGGILLVEGELKRSGGATVPASELKRWEDGGPPTLFVLTRNDRGDPIRNRVDAYRSESGR